MGARNDDKYDALKAQGYLGALPDMWAHFKRDNAVTGSQSWFDHLRAEGYTGTTPIMEAQFWRDGGIFNPVTINILDTFVALDFPQAIEVDLDRPTIFHNGTGECDPAPQFTVTGSATGAHSVLAVVHDPFNNKNFGVITAEHFDVGETVTWNYDDTGICKIIEIHGDVLASGDNIATNDLVDCDISAFGHLGLQFHDLGDWTDTCPSFRG